MRYRYKRIIYGIILLLSITSVYAIDDPTHMGILNAKNIAYAGFGILGIFLLTMIAWGITQFSKGGDILTLALTAVTGGVLLILAFFIIYNLALASIISTSNSTESPQELMMMMSMPLQAITNLRVCADETLPCTTTGLPDTWVTVYWEVVGGVGCCNTFGCNYELYQQFCGTPFQGFRLYDIAIDAVVDEWGQPIDINYTYNCSHNTPWNYHYFNVTPGIHNVTIWQKDCRNIVDIQTISFELIDRGGSYDIQQI